MALAVAFALTQGCATAPLRQWRLRAKPWGTGAVLVEKRGDSERIVRNTGSARVVVRDSRTGEAIADAGPGLRTPYPGSLPLDSGFLLVHPPGRIPLEVAAPGYAPWTGSAEVVRGREVLVQATLDPLPPAVAPDSQMVLVGRVVHAEDGSPVRSAVFRVDRAARTVSRNDGTYRLVVPLNRAGSGARITVHLSRIGLATTERTIAVRPGREVQCDFFMFVDGDLRLVQ